MRTHLNPLACALLAVLLLAAAAGADEASDNLKKTTPAQRATVLDTLMKGMFSPTAEQESQIAALNLKYAEKMEPVIKGDAGFFTRMSEMKRINGEKEVELQKILTPAQWTTYLDGKSEMRAQFDKMIAAQQP